MLLKDSRVLAVTATSALILLVGLLVLQHLRHGWPFSLHHGVVVSPAARPTTMRPGATSAPVHPRADVELDATQAGLSGVRIEKVRVETSAQPIRAVATVVPDESRVSHVHTRVAGWIEQLYVDTTGERVRAGQPLAGIFSQELLSTQSEYLAARRTAVGSPRSVVAEGARSRLIVLGMTDAEIRAIEQAGEPRRLVTVSAPRTGIVLHRGISVGTAVDPSTEIVTIADLSRVWVLAELSEGDIPRVRIGTPAVLEFAASAREPIESRVEFLYPTLSERTRTLRVRFAVDNSGGTFRPGIYGSATFQTSARSALTIPRDAVVDTGGSQHVFVAAGQWRFEPRSVKLGARFGDRTEVLQGLKEGEEVVASGVFLIDSESRLRASGGGTGHAHGTHGVDERQKPAASHEGHTPTEAPDLRPANPTRRAQPADRSREQQDRSAPSAPRPAIHEGHPPAPNGHSGH